MLFSLILVFWFASVINAEASFSRIFVLILENRDFEQVADNRVFSSLASKGLLLTNYHGLTHPSQPNYLTMIAGDHFGLTSNLDVNLTETTLVDLLEAKGLSWRTYQEKYPGNCFAGTRVPYYRKHNPFISFNNIRENPQRCSKIVTEAEYAADLAANTLPHYSMYTPDINNDGHDESTEFMARWLDGFMDQLLGSQHVMKDTLVFVTFDEGINLVGPNRVWSVLYGPGITPNTTDNTRYDHYSMLRTIEDHFELGNLGRHDATAIPFAKVKSSSDIDIGEDPIDPPKGKD